MENHEARLLDSLSGVPQVFQIIETIAPCPIFFNYGSSGKFVGEISI